MIVAPAQTPNSGVTAIAAVCGAPAPEAVNCTDPIPEAGNPIAGLEFVQRYCAPGVPLNGIATVSPGHTAVSATGFITGALTI